MLFSSKGACNVIYKIVIDGEDWYMKCDKSGNPFLQQSYVIPMRASDFEVFASFMLKRISPQNLKNDILDYEFADCLEFGISGCISKSFLKQNENLISFTPMLLVDLYNEKYGTKFKYLDYRDNCVNFASFYNTYYNYGEGFTDRYNGKFKISVQHIVKSMKDFCMEFGYKCNLKKMEIDLEKMVVCDYFISNYDRHAGNICFIIDEHKNLKLAPNFDNSLSNGAIWDFYENTYNINAEKGIFMCTNQDVTLSEDGEKVDFTGNKLYGNKGILPIEIYALTKNSATISEIVNNFLSLDLDECFSDFALEKGIELSWEQKERIATYFNKKREDYLKKINRLNEKIYKRKNKGNIDLNTQYL